VIRFDTYYRHAELTRVLRELAEARPDLVRLQSIGRSFEGKDIWLATVTRFASGPDTDKPALWVDGNIHATELAGSAACLHLLHYLVAGCDRDPEVSRCLDTRVFYVCPRLNPDGAEWALADVPRLIRSGTRPYPHEDPLPGGLVREDIDGDGRVLMMRIADADGPWKVSDRDPRLLVRREPAETGGRYYRLLPEGRIENFDGSLIPLQRPREGLDLNRNFPAGWRQEHVQLGAGPYPTSEPEVRAAVDFIARHPNITAAIAFHTYSGVLLRPYSHQPDDALPIEDLRTYQTIGARGTVMTGYPNVSVYHEFRYHPKDVITGSFDDWMYDHRGVFSWTIEIWSPQRQAGIFDIKLIDWYREHPVEDDLKLLQWNDEALGGKGFVPWYAFQHPQLGAVELGGWDGLFSWSNPPPALLEKEIERFAPWLVWHLLISPRLEIHEAGAVRLEGDTWRVRLVVKNSGWLPSYVTKRALEAKLARGVICEIELPAEAKLTVGPARQEIGQLEGRAYTPVAPAVWTTWSGDATDERAKAEWVIAAPPGTTVKLKARHDRAGAASTEIRLS
jgi:murein tripeptide amidase MpaA